MIDHLRSRECSRMPPVDLRAARANRVFCTDKNHPRRKRGYVEKQKQRGLLYKIADYARMVFHPCVIGDPRGRPFVRAISKLCNKEEAV